MVIFLLPDFLDCSIVVVFHLQHPVGGICVDLSGMDKVLEIHGMRGTGRSLLGLTVPRRG